MPLYRDDAVVLRVHKLGEADRIITLLTRQHGRVRAVGKGVRRTSSKFGARLEPGSHIDVQLHTRYTPEQVPVGNRGLDQVVQTESLGAFGARIANDYPRWTAASVICETAERLTEEGEPALRLYLLVVGALRALAEHDARARARPRRVPDPGDGDLGLGAGARRVRQVRRARAARGVQRAGRRRGLRELPPAGVRPSAAGDDRR